MTAYLYSSSRPVDHEQCIQRVGYDFNLKKRVRDFSKNIKDRNIKTTNKFKKLYNNVKRSQRRSNMIFRYAYGNGKE